MTYPNETYGDEKKDIMSLVDIKRENLRRYAKEMYGVEFNQRGYAHCPFHPDDKNPSLSTFRDDDGVWRFVDHHVEEETEGRTGTIVDFIAQMEKISDSDSCKKLLKEYGPQGQALEENIRRYQRLRQSSRRNSSEPTVEREHIYKDSRGRARLKKVKLRSNSGEKSWKTYHRIGNRWR